MAIEKTRVEIARMDYGQVKKEYTRLRDIFRKRVERASKKGLKEAEKYRLGGALEFGYISQETFGQTADQARRTLIRAITELNRLIFGGQGQMAFGLGSKGRKKRSDSTEIADVFQRHGHNIAKSVVKNLTGLLELLRQEYGKKLPGSMEVVEWFEGLKYKYKRASPAKLKQLWEDFVSNGYQEPENGNYDLFTT